MGNNKRPLIYSEKWTFRLTPDQLQTIKELRKEYKIPINEMFRYILDYYFEDVREQLIKNKINNLN